MEPFDTFRAEPRRFAVGLPIVFGGSLVVAVPLVEVSFSLALAVLLALQTAGCAALYVPALRRRWRPDDAAPSLPGLEFEGDDSDPGASERALDRRKSG